MDKAVIVGTFDFMGFHFCTTLLEKGTEVFGIAFGDCEPYSFNEEKRLEIGRNANFIETSLSDWHVTFGKDPEDILVVIDYYDLSLRAEKYHIFNSTVFEQFINSITENSKVILLAPIQLLVHKHCEQKEKYTKLLNSLKTKGLLINEFYLPTVYGPWQSDHFTFTKQLIKNLSDGDQTKDRFNEWKQDALYASDVVETILILADQAEDKYILRSKEGNLWANCAEYLSIDFKEKDIDPLPSIFNECERTVVKETPYQVGLETQRAHLKSLLEDMEM
ncbi:hypothetical protein ACFYKX_07045 [Cytobacillus sp. FJAT-54145]|uniref:UDP-glucose 4-epimerase n=1 Tax=Cytobacillus spartinae TaxID=3299023 RepID=A0ABW6K853_9BACI